MEAYPDIDPYAGIYNPAFLAKVHAKQRAASVRSAKAEKEDAARDREVRILMLAEEARTARIEILAKKEARVTAALDQMWAHIAAEKQRDRDLFKHIVGWVSKATGVGLGQVFGASRARPVTRARQAIYYWASRRTGLSIARIGSLMDKDHTSVLHGNKAYVAKRALKGRHLRAAR